jgi:hypothetical protein
MSDAPTILDLTGETQNLRPDKPFNDIRAWTRANLTPDLWTVLVTDSMRDELRAVVIQLRQQNLPTFMLQPEHFKLAASRTVMAEARHRVDDTCGFAIIDRLPLDEWTLDEIKSVYWLLGKILCRPVAQNATGEMFRDIRYQGDNDYGGRDRSLTMQRLTYHNDNSGNRNVPHYQSLLCLNAAAEGGLSEYCSIYSLYNALLEVSPVELERLFHPFYHNRFGLQADKEAVAIRAPALTWDGARLFGRCSINKITGGYRVAEQEIDNVTRATLERVVSIIPEKELSAQYLLTRGQTCIINNREGVHHREAYKDSDSDNSKRHLLRMWFREEGREVFDG